MDAVKTRVLNSFGPGADSSCADKGDASPADQGGFLNPSIQAARDSSSPVLNPKGFCSHVDQGWVLNPSIQAVRDSSLLTPNPNEFLSPVATKCVSRSQKRRNRRARLKISRGMVLATTLVIGQHMFAGAWRSCLSDFASPTLNKDNVLVSKDSPDCSSFGVLLDAVEPIKDSSEVTNNDEMGCVSIVLKSGKKMVILRRQGL